METWRGANCPGCGDENRNGCTSVPPTGVATGDQGIRSRCDSHVPIDRHACGELAAPTSCGDRTGRLDERSSTPIRTTAGGRWRQAVTGRVARTWRHAWEHDTGRQVATRRSRPDKRFRKQQVAPDAHRLPLRGTAHDVHSRGNDRLSPRAWGSTVCSCSCPTMQASPPARSSPRGGGELVVRRALGQER